MTGVEVCLCGRWLATWSARSAELTTTAEVTARGDDESTPVARPFVEGRGAGGEFALGVVRAAAWIGSAWWS